MYFFKLQNIICCPSNDLLIRLFMVPVTIKAQGLYTLTSFVVLVSSLLYLSVFSLLSWLLMLSYFIWKNVKKLRVKTLI